MKLILFAALFVLLFTPVFGQLSDRTGLVNRLDVETSGHTFEVETVANFDVTDHEFDKNEKRLTIFISSGLENNLGELIIPKELLGGNLTFSLNDQDYSAKYRSNDKISFVTLNFTGNGTHKLDVYGAVVLPNSDVIEKTPETTNAEGGGCLIATAAYGSEMVPQVQFLREIRDGKIMSTSSGAAFMTGFNQFYYSFSPTVADYQREHPVFKEMVRIGITPMLATLSVMNYAESEQEMLGYGIAVILMNAGIYFAVPAAFLFVLNNKLRH